VAGGLATNRALLDTVDVYDPSTDTWTALSRMPSALEGAAAAVLNDKLYVMGGSTASSGLPMAVFDEVYIYDPASDSWSIGPPMTTPRYGAAATVSGQTVLLAGGYTAIAPTSMVETLALRGPTCDDGNACTTTDVCTNGTCGGTAVTCPADQCHNAGTCVPATGCPAATSKPDGTACNDSNACTQTDTCQAGTCVGGNAVTCTAQDTCHAAGTCAPATGLCSNPVKPNNATCDDGQTCTQSETCQAGTCVAPTNPSQPYPVVLNLPVDYLGTFGPQSFVNDINSSGVSVGWSSTTDLQHRAWRANGRGTITDLSDQLGLGFPSSAQAINDSNTIVGFQTTPDGKSHIFRSGAAGREDLADPGDPNDTTQAVNEQIYVLNAGVYVRGAFPTDINNAGDIVGFYTAGGKFRGFRILNGGSVEDVPPLATGGATWLYGVSETGAAVGATSMDTTDFGRTHAVYYDNDVLSDLNVLVPHPEWELQTATSIEGDYIVGMGILNGDGVSRAYRLHWTSQVIDDISGGWYSSTARKVNAAGDTVGVGVRLAEDLVHGADAGSPLVFTDVLGFKNLRDMIQQDLGWSVKDATSINAAGDIVGAGFYTNGWGYSPWHVKLPAGQAAVCKARNTCGGGDGDSICLFSDGVAQERTPERTSRRSTQASLFRGR
jgi:hypothetical protein